MHEQVGSCSGTHIISKLVDFSGCNEFHNKPVSSQKANAAVVFQEKDWSLPSRQTGKRSHDSAALIQS